VEKLPILAEIPMVAGLGCSKLRVVTKQFGLNRFGIVVLSQPAILLAQLKFISPEGDDCLEVLRPLVLFKTDRGQVALGGERHPTRTEFATRRQLCLSTVRRILRPGGSRAGGLHLSDWAKQKPPPDSRVRLKNKAI